MDKITKKLIKQSLAGSTEAFGSIVNQYQGSVCAITYAMTGNIATSEDLAQETFIKAWQELDKLKRIESFLPWLCKIAKNQAIGWLNKTTKHRNIGIDNIAELQATDESESIASQEQYSDMLWDTVSQLDEKYRLPLVLYYRNSESIKDVAIALELTEETVRQRLSRARNMLRDQMADNIDEFLQESSPKRLFGVGVVSAITAAGLTNSASAAGVTIGAFSAITSVITGKVAAIVAGVIITAAVIGGAVMANKAAIADQDIANLSTNTTNISQTASMGDIPQNNILDGLALSRTMATKQDIPITDETPTNIEPPQSQKVGVVVSPVKQEKKQAENPLTGVSGIVVDKVTGEPIAGAKLEFNKYMNAVSDKNGKFELTKSKDKLPKAPEGITNFEMRVSVSADTYAYETAIFNATINKVLTGQKIELVKGSDLEGFVKDERGEPIVGVLVENFYGPRGTVKTDSDGYFKIDGFNPEHSDYSVKAECKGFKTAKVNFVPAAAGEKAFLEIVMTKGATLSGKVVDYNGNPVANAVIGNTTSRAMWNHLETKSKADGTFELKNLPAGELVLWVIPQKDPPFVDKFTISESGRSDYVIQLDKPTVLEGQVVDGLGAPIPGIRVSLMAIKDVRNIDNGRVTTNAEGKFKLSKMPQDGMVKLSVFGSGISGFQPEVAVGTGQMQTIIVNRSGKIYGKVIDSDTNKPIEKFTVKLGFTEFKDENRPSAGYAATWSRQGHGFTSIDGCFDTGTEDLPVSGYYKVSVFADGYDSCIIDPVEVLVAGNSPVRTEFKLKKSIPVEGVIVDITGMPVNGARIRWFSSDNRIENSEVWTHDNMDITDADGKFQLTGMGAGQRGIIVACEGYGSYIDTSIVLPDDTAKLERIMLEPEVIITGKVFDDGNPVANQKVSVRLPIGESISNSRMGYYSGAQVTTDSQGYYEIFNLPAGKIVIELQDDSFTTLRSKNIVAEVGKDYEVNFGDDEGGFTLSGYTKAGPHPLSGIIVKVTLDKGRSVVASAKSDGNGFFEMMNVPKGLYKINAVYAPDGMKKYDTIRSYSEEYDLDCDRTINIDFGSGSLSGVIKNPPANLVVNLKRKYKKPLELDFLTLYFRHVGMVEIGADGKFEFDGLTAGEYYLSANTNSKTYGLTELFKLGKDQHLSNVNIEKGDCTLDVKFVDMQTGQPLSDVTFELSRRDLRYSFYDINACSEGQYKMQSGIDGTMTVEGICPGEFVVSSSDNSHLKSSVKVVIEKGKKNSITVSLVPASCVVFKLSDQLKKEFEGKFVFVMCSVLDEQGNLVAEPSEFGDSVTERFALVQSHTSEATALMLKNGNYRISYKLSSQDPNGEFKKIGNERIVEVAVDGNLEIVIN